MKWLVIGVLVGMMSAMTGCAATGTKSVDMWGLKWENYAGMDVHAGFNNIDNVDDRRGVGSENGRSFSNKGVRY